MTGVQTCALPIYQLGAKVVTLSDSSGTVHDPDGIDAEKLDWIMQLKNVRRGRIKEYADKFHCKYLDGGKPWSIPCDCAFPSATQNELDGEDAKTLLRNGCTLVSEGANMPSTPDAVAAFMAARILFGPAKAANAGGVATSGLEMAQNAQYIHWKAAEVDARLHGIMENIFKAIDSAATEYGQEDNYVTGANIAGFLKVADAMVAHGCV